MIEIIKKYFSRWFVFGDVSRPIIPFKVNLLYWKPAGTNNVGDLLSLVIFRYMIDSGGVNNGLSFSTKRLVSIGSVLSFVGSGKTTVWGTGLMNSECVLALKHPLKHVLLDLRAVRGPITRKRLVESGFNCPEIYGDPAILLPLYYNPKIEKEDGKVIIIPHHSRFEKYSMMYKNVLDTYTNDWQSFVNEIKSAQKVISSSLHGIILAESYGIPCVWLNDIPDSSFKYEDYYQSTGRTSYPIAESVEKGMEMKGEINDNLLKMQQDLLSSFPYDLF